MESPSNTPQVEVSVSLKYSARVSVLTTASQEDDFIVPVTTEIIGVGWQNSEEAERNVVLGELKFQLIRVGNAVNAGVSRHDVFDVSQSTLDAGSAIYDASFQDYNTTVRKMFEDASPWDDVMLLSQLEIHPFARGQKLGLAVLIQAIKDWSSGCSLVVMKPFPLQFVVEARRSKRWESLALADFPQKEKQSFQKLRSYYEQIGFKRIGRSEFYALCVRETWAALEVLELPEEFSVPNDKLTTSV